MYYDTILESDADVYFDLYENKKIVGRCLLPKGEPYTIEYFVNTTFNYPTMAEAFRVAALNGLNRLF